MRALVAAVLVTFAAPGVAAASHGPLHGPSPTPLLAELMLAAVVMIGILGRHAAVRVMQSVVHATIHGLRSLAHHRPHRARPPNI